VVSRPRGRPKTKFKPPWTRREPFREGSAMISIRRIRSTCIAMFATMVTVLITAPNVLAQIKPHDPGGSISIPIPAPPAAPAAPAPPAAVVSYGSPIWMFVVVALLAALLTTAALLISHKLRHASRFARSAHLTPAAIMTGRRPRPVIHPAEPPTDSVAREGKPGTGGLVVSRGNPRSSRRRG
jgi:hypothetical protein